MGKFLEWATNRLSGTDEVISQLDRLYDKAKYAVKLVQMYSKATGKRLLHNITTIAPLNSGVYGLYNSGENKRVIGPAAASKIKFKFGQEALSSQNIQTLPQYVIKQHLPDVDESQIAPSDVIHVNVSRIVREMGDSPEAILEIASTIVHEATHEIEFHSRGKTDETGPKKAEQDFRSWAQANWRSILAAMPQINLQSRRTM